MTILDPAAQLIADVREACAYEKPERAWLDDLIRKADAAEEWLKLYKAHVFEEAAKEIRSATLPDHFQWSESNREKFNFGLERAILQLHAKAREIDQRISVRVNWRKLYHEVTSMGLGRLAHLATEVRALQETIKHPRCGRTHPGINQSCDKLMGHHEEDHVCCTSVGLRFNFFDGR